jgi:signal transduction histidine kinase/CheY-like chemotaxis protein
MVPACSLYRRRTYGSLLLLLWSAPVAAQPHRAHNVLLLNSYHVGYAWSDELMRGVRAVLDSRSDPVELWIETMDTRRMSGPEYEQQVEDFLRAKYAGRRLDALVVSDDPALRFVLPRHDRLFPGVPVVYCGINSLELARSAPPETYTGVVEVVRPGHVLDVAIHMLPATRRVVVVNDATPTSISIADEFRELATHRTDLAFTFLDGSRVPFDALLAELAQTTATDVVLATSFALDSEGHYNPKDTGMARIVAAAHAPVIGPSTDHVPGLLGGNENRGYFHGRIAGQMASRLLDGQRPGDVARQQDSTTGFVIDSEQALRWGVDESRFPPEVIVRDRSTSYYASHPRLVWAGAGFLGLEALVIGLLWVNVNRRRRAERALAAQADSLARSNTELALANTSLRTEMEERRTAEEQLRQSQKIEAVGRLAGGVAHDFNNLLTVIASYGDLAWEALPPEASARGHVEQIRLASERAAALTQQLLAFSRKQVLQPKVVDLNRVVGSLQPMLQTLLGEDIGLDVRLSETPAMVVVDAGQIEQVVVNLAANARDAMPDGGRLAIETCVVVFEEDVDVRSQMTAGRYVQLTVTDSGHGIDEHTKLHIFEPFFTTKAPGKGTGLGLSMAYGIVKQSGGWIWVYSEPGQGTTFKIYLPACAERTVLPIAPAVLPKQTRPPATETILLVEDQPEVRTLAARVLRTEGYTVLEAGDGDNALEQATEHGGPIHLLLTDVVMPGLSGRQVAERFALIRPGAKVLFVSGYTDNVILHRGALQPGTEFLAKPFTPDVLADRVREVLSK